MKSNYKKLGQYIREVNIRNIEEKKDNLLGVSVSKVFIPSIANTVGTDFTKYKVVKKNQFTYIPDTSRRGDKIGIALLEDVEEGLVSQAYTVFEIAETEKLLPVYLMMWFRRPEFDRYARFISHGSVREIFSWEDMCNVELPIPSIIKQKEIVNEYNVLVDRINLNNRLIQKLEETAQAIYKQWFINFEFPDENGKPYKSNGGKMEFNKELDKEIPKGWEIGSLKSISKVITGVSFKGEDYSFDEGISVLRGENVTEQRIRWDTHKKWNKSFEGLEDYFLKAQDIVIGMDGSKVGKNWSLISGYDLPLLLAQRVACVRATSPNFQLFIYYSLIVLSFAEYVSQVQTGTSIPHISGNQILDFPLLIPSETCLEMFDLIAIKLMNHMMILNHQNTRLTKLKDILMENMTSIKEVCQ